jgi:hypothetical protein
MNISSDVKDFEIFMWIFWSQHRYTFRFVCSCFLNCTISNCVRSELIESKRWLRHRSDRRPLIDSIFWIMIGEAIPFELRMVTSSSCETARSLSNDMSSRSVHSKSYSLKPGRTHPPTWLTKFDVWWRVSFTPGKLIQNSKHDCRIVLTLRAGMSSVEDSRSWPTLTGVSTDNKNGKKLYW